MIWVFISPVPETREVVWPCMLLLGELWETDYQAFKLPRRAGRSRLHGKYGLHSDIDPKWGRLLVWKWLLVFVLHCI